MYTQCPHCQTCFRIAEAHLKAAGGKVRCGSCQEVFDAGGHLYTKLPPVEENRVPAEEEITITPADLKRVEHDHIDLSATPAPGDKHIPTKQPPRQNQTSVPTDIPKPAPQPDQSHFMESTIGDNARYNNLDNMGSIPLPGESVPDDTPKPTPQPDQSRFMESTIGDNSRYNNLDNMDAIHVPGDLEFSDSFLQFDEPSKPKQTPDSGSGVTNPYEDTEATEAPVSDEEASGISDLYSAADEMMRGGEFDAENQHDTKSQLDRDIDELLAFADSLNSDKTAFDKEEVELPADEDIADDLFAIQPQTENTVSQQHDTAIDLDSADLSFEPFTPEPETPDPANSISNDSSNNEPISHPSGKLYDDLQEFEKELEADDFDSGSSFSEFNPAAVLEPEMDTAPQKSTEQIRQEELPSIRKEIPLSLRRSLEKMDLPGRPWYITTALVLAIILLLGGLGVQMILFRNVDLANSFPALRPLLISVCNTLPCRYAGPHDVSKISLTNRDVRSHPTQKNALLVSAAFVNQASFDQPYPNLLITLSDLSGHVVARRMFTPAEYLENIYHQFLLMESGTPVHITLPVLDPGDDAINFEFTFH